MGKVLGGRWEQETVLVEKACNEKPGSDLKQFVRLRKTERRHTAILPCLFILHCLRAGELPP